MSVLHMMISIGILRTVRLHASGRRRGWLDGTFLFAQLGDLLGEACKMRREEIPVCRTGPVEADIGKDEGGKEMDQTGLSCLRLCKE